MNNKCNITDQYTDEELLILMSYKDDDEEEAKEAFRVFYNRYNRLLLSLCMRACTKRYLSDSEKIDLSEIVFQNTMMKIYQKSHLYNASKGKISTWMSRIAENELIDQLYLQDESIIYIEETISELELPSNYNDDNIIQTETFEMKILDEALNTLTDKEKDILLTYMMYKEDQKKLPEDVIDNLRKRYSTTSENLRQIRHRSLNKIKMYIQNNTNIVIKSNMQISYEK